MTLASSCCPLHPSTVLPTSQLERQLSFTSRCAHLLRFVPSYDGRPRREVVQQRCQSFRRSNVRAVARVNLVIPPALLSLRTLSKLPEEVLRRWPQAVDIRFGESCASAHQVHWLLERPQRLHDTPWRCPSNVLGGRVRR